MKATTANFEALYAPKWSEGIQPATDAKLTRSPRPRSSMPGSVAYVTFTVPP